MPCDSPFLPADLVARLASALGDNDLAVAKTGAQAHPVFALVRRTLLAHLAAEDFGVARGHRGHVVGQREGRDFQAGVADFRGEGGGFGERDGAEGFVADGVAHGGRKAGRPPRA